MSSYVVPAKAGTHIPEPVIMGPQHKRVYARLRHAMRGDDKTVMRGFPIRSPDFAAAVFRRGDDLHVLVRTGDGAERLVDVPLVLHLARLLGAHRVHLHHHLVVVGTEVRFARLHHVEFRALAQMLGQLLRIGGLGLAHRLRHDLERVVVAPRLVVGKSAVFLLEYLGVFFRARRVDKVVPHQRPDAGEIALPAPQATTVSKPKPATGNGRPYSEYCLRKLVIWLPARFDTTRSGRA